ncbi:hypothetical protein TNCV_3021771 [Trichonephila clavipes]|nr:hypothetical protein TNCV_3021771 [Trichonephila clavipes]
MWSMFAQRLTYITPPAATPDQLWQRVETAWFAVPQEHFDEAGHFPLITTDPLPFPTNVQHFRRFLNCWEGILELGPRRHKETH